MIKRTLHPITGGPDGKGWAFGMPLVKNDIFNILEKIDGIYYIEEIELYDEEARVEVEKILVDEDDLLYIKNIDIVERKYQY